MSTGTHHQQLPAFASPESSAFPPSTLSLFEEFEANSSTDFMLLTWLRGQHFSSIPNLQSVFRPHLCVGRIWGDQRNWGRGPSGSTWGGKGTAPEQSRTGYVICTMKIWSPLFKNYSEVQDDNSRALNQTQALCNCTCHMPMRPAKGCPSRTNSLDTGIQSFGAQERHKHPSPPIPGTFPREVESPMWETVA